MADYDQIEQVVKDILAEQLGMKASHIHRDDLLTEKLGMDSFASIETAFALEEKFGLSIPDEAIYQAKTVKDIVDFIAANVQPGKSV